ncbi:MAG: pyridoxamine 5'-phosphate oxidase family protein [Candidatus Bipolaricaulota bacterium]|nr:MAG: pyridoxamine 5'-phosphate oxidase family protein [Candidatus Bipolaricaulota bacterium]
MGKSIEEYKADVWQQFREVQRVYLATSEKDQPRVRPVMLIDYDEKFWIATAMESRKACQIRNNPSVEFCLPLAEGDANGYIRVAGVADPVDDPSWRKEIGERFGYFAEYWSGPDDPDYLLLRITRVEVEYLPPGETEAVTFLV